MFNYFKEDFTPVISATVPESQIDLDGKKADIIIALMIETKQTIQKWGERALTATSWSVGIVLSIVAYYILHGNSITGRGRFVIGFGVLLFGILTQLYLYSARRAHEGNGVVLIKCQAALKMHNIGEYFKDDIFCGYDGKYPKSKSLKILNFFHIIVVLYSLLVFSFVSPAQKDSPDHVKKEMAEQSQTVKKL